MRWERAVLLSRVEHATPYRLDIALRSQVSFSRLWISRVVRQSFSSRRRRGLSMDPEKQDSLKDAETSTGALASSSGGGSDDKTRFQRVTEFLRTWGVETHG